MFFKLLHVCVGVVLNLQFTQCFGYILVICKKSKRYSASGSLMQVYRKMIFMLLIQGDELCNHTVTCFTAWWHLVKNRIMNSWVIETCTWNCFLSKWSPMSLVNMNNYITHTHTHPFNGPFSGLPGWAGIRNVKPIWILLKQETVSGSGISWTICKSAPCSRQITMPAPHHSVFYRLDALPAAQPTASNHWRHKYE